MTMKGLPLTYNRDMQEDKEPLFEAADQLSGSLEMARAVIGAVKLDAAKPLAAIMQSWVVAADLAEEMARRGTPFHQAHQTVGRLVLESIRQGKEPDLLPELARLLDPKEGLKSRELPGGTGPESVARALQQAQGRLNQMRA
jgi:argininosuccinate lyase